MVSTRLRVILVAGLRYVPFVLHVVLLGVIYGRNSQHTSVLPTANTANVWGSIALLTFKVYHRVPTNEYAAVLTYCQHFLYT